MTYSTSSARISGDEITRERLSSYTASSSSEELMEGTSRREIEDPPSEGGADGMVMEEDEKRCSVAD